MITFNNHLKDVIKRIDTLENKVNNLFDTCLLEINKEINSLKEKEKEKVNNLSGNGPKKIKNNFW